MKQTKPISSTNLSIQGIVVRNAGIVLLNSYLPILLERLDLLEDGSFRSMSLHTAAPSYLQYAVTGLTSAEETDLRLNKVLCGLPLSAALPLEIVITDEHKKLIDGLIQAAIAHWPAIGKCSVDGFRGNWLVRDGLLSELPDRWELKVEKRAYDILINKSPFAFSIIKYRWMDKPLHVVWPY